MTMGNFIWINVLELTQSPKNSLPMLTGVCAAVPREK